MGLVIEKEKYSIMCDLNCSQKSQIFIKDDCGNAYLHICNSCASKLFDCLKNQKKKEKKE